MSMGDPAKVNIFCCVHLFRASSEEAGSASLPGGRLFMRGALQRYRGTDDREAQKLTSVPSKCYPSDSYLQNNLISIDAGFWSDQSNMMMMMMMVVTVWCLMAVGNELVEEECQWTPAAV